MILYVSVVSLPGQAENVLRACMTVQSNYVIVTSGECLLISKTYVSDIIRPYHPGEVTVILPKICNCIMDLLAFGCRSNYIE